MSTYGFDDISNRDNIIPSIFLSVYPVGSIYMSTNPTSPASLFGGTWEALDDGRVLIGAGTAHPAGEVGGEETHKLITDEMPSHYHGFTDTYRSRYTTYHPERGGVRPLDTAYAVTGTTYDNDTTDSRGGSKAHNNMQPYLSVYMWTRTA